MHITRTTNPEWLMIFTFVNDAAAVVAFPFIDANHSPASASYAAGIMNAT